ncbi:MAG: proline dehydrogenase family protein [Acidobacteria bacterium]|nr:proline dehydrogenase family protein [Acidobacteriota bacterium]
MLIRNFIFYLSTKQIVTQAISSRGMKYGFARRFVAGVTLRECLEVSRELNRQGRRVSLNHLGEDVTTREEAVRVKDGYIEMLRALAGENRANGVKAAVDGNISIKFTQLGLSMATGGRELCVALTEEIAAAAKSLGLAFEVDMESSSYTDITLDIFETVCKKYLGATLAIQAYLHRSEKDLERLGPLQPKIRLVKGAYREPASVAIQKKADVDANYRKLLGVLLNGGFSAAIATQDPAMQEFAIRLLKERNTPREKYEFQMMYGVRRDLQDDIAAKGHPQRIYVPFGDAWCPYFMRRISERPANCWFVMKSLAAEGLRR